ncbi:acetyl-CoA C-acetyltransferase [Desulfofundulus australicus DSM 11792]|uniref:Acetyl-CoA acetyltransferase n=1 Tax=Desulfofundulus australicus DSM 11792 TaxID=1121425 RepID=A0A1M5AKF6_9FIRM|nr:thiolase family protein [Desulfofundulus australicus]SHF30645.1 acetyl-CoA C-acetyltransferase [Desulfofundulus australicus DSM 11792]
MREAVIVGAARTPIARENGALKDVPPEELAAVVMKEAVARSGLEKPELIDEVIFGHCLGAVGCLGRMALLKAGLPMEIPAITIDRQCGSGSTALNLAAAHIWAGVGDIYLVGGAESMTRQPYLLEKPLSFQRTPPRWISPRPLSPQEIGDPPMGITAENVAERFNVSREEQDEFAYLSQMKAARAIREGRFKEQIVPLTIPQKKGEPVVFEVDEHPRPNTTVEVLAKLPPVFKKGGTVTAGNSSGINDGAGALLITSREKAEELGLKPLAVVRAFGSAGVDPNIMGMGPVPATRKALARAGLTIEQMDVIELNEAFASQAIACCRELGIDWRDQEKLNPNGGAIALGHPIAATLAILVIKAVYELHRRSGRYALITACCGGGQGVATIIERC